MDPESGNPDFQSVHVNQLSKSFKMSGHMIFFRISGFSGFPDPESGNPDFPPSWRDPGVKPDPTVPHLWGVGGTGVILGPYLTKM